MAKHKAKAASRAGSSSPMACSSIAITSFRAAACFLRRGLPFDAYVNFVRDRALLEAIASSLTELFSPQIISERIEGMLKHYDFVTSETLEYFSQRPPQAERDSRFALDYVKAKAVTAETQQAVLAALEFKCSVLWAMLDALYHAYVTPGHIPPGAFAPDDEGHK